MGVGLPRREWRCCQTHTRLRCKWENCDCSETLVCPARSFWTFWWWILLIFNLISGVRCRCSPCHDSCDSCRGESSDECVTCRRGLFFLDGACRDICPSGYRPDSRRRECVQCAAGCSSCSAAACLTCAAGWLMSSRGTARCVPQGNDHCDSGKRQEAVYQFTCFNPPLGALGQRDHAV